VQPADSSLSALFAPPLHPVSWATQGPSGHIKRRTFVSSKIAHMMRVFTMACFNLSSVSCTATKAIMGQKMLHKRWTHVFPLRSMMPAGKQMSLQRT
jgi:hypothetical protein